MKQHKIGKLIPPPNEEDYARVRDSIAEHGQSVRIWIHEDQVLDGWTRYRACKELDVQVKTR